MNKRKMFFFVALSVILFSNQAVYGLSEPPTLIIKKCPRANGGLYSTFLDSVKWYQLDSLVARTSFSPSCDCEIIPEDIPNTYTFPSLAGILITRVNIGYYLGHETRYNWHEINPLQNEIEYSFISFWEDHKGNTVRVEFKNFRFLSSAPLLSEMALILFCFLMMGFSIWMIRKRFLHRTS